MAPEVRDKRRRTESDLVMFDAWRAVVSLHSDSDVDDDVGAWGEVDVAEPDDHDDLRPR